MYQMKANLIGVKTNIMNMKSTHAMTSAMKNTARAMVRMNRQFKIPAMQKIMKEFMKEQMKSEDLNEMMGDMIDETTAEEGEDEVRFITYYRIADRINHPILLSVVFYFLASLLSLIPSFRGCFYSSITPPRLCLVFPFLRFISFPSLSYPFTFLFRLFSALSPATP